MQRLDFIFTLRHLWRNKFFTTLNILGLTLGLSAAIWLLLYLKNELTYDLHFEGHESTYRISGIFEAPGVRFNTAFSASELAPLLKEEFPELLAYARFVAVGNEKIDVADKEFLEQDMFYTDAEVFQVFSLNLLEGDPNSALDEPNSVVISESTSKKLFASNSGVNEVIKINGNDVKVTGVFQDLPKNTHFNFNVLLSGIYTRDWAMPDGVFNSEVLWNADCLTYLKFTDEFDEAHFLDRFKSFNEKYFMPFGKVVSGQHHVRLQRLADIHYSPEVLDDDYPKGSQANLLTFSAIGFAILLLACINYINLATSRGRLRAKEIGIRKVLGSNALRLRSSLLLESMSQVILSLALSVAIVWVVITKTSFQSWLGTDFDFNLFEQLDLLIAVIGLAHFTGLISGAYPAIYLSNIKPVNSLKGVMGIGNGRNGLRQFLVLFQFIVSIGVLSSTLLMRDQLNFIQNKDLGFSKDQVMVVSLQDSAVRANVNLLKNRLSDFPGILSTSSTNNAPGIQIDQIVFKVDQNGAMEQQEFKFVDVDVNYLETLGIELKEGKYFRGDETRGNQYFVINETAAKVLGWENPIGKRLGFFHQDEPGQVIGVVKDFNFHSLHNPITPMVLAYFPNSGRNLLIRYRPERQNEIVSIVESAWNELYPNQTFAFSFLNDRLAQQYASDQNQNQLISIMAGLCIIIALIGLSGLTAFNVNQRTKEIGIRKVLGAMPGHIVYLIFSGTFRLVILASIIAGPITYLLFDQWLDNFAYRISFNVFIVLSAIILAIILTLTIVGGHVLKTTNKNPSVTLRHD